MKKYIISICLFMLILCTAGCSDDLNMKEKNQEKLEWPDSGISTVIPVPDFDYGTIKIDTKDRFSADIYNVEREDYEFYVEECEQEGFIINSKSDSDKYIAYNESGYKIRIQFNEDDKKFSIRVNLTNEENRSETTSIPTEQNNKEKETELTTSEEVEKTTEKATEKATEKVTEKPTIKETEPPTEKEKENKDNKDNEDVSEDFKATMDSYEAFFDKYIDFMNKYSSSDDSLSMFTEYLDFINQYSDVMKKLEDIDEDELSPADQAYYIEVMARISQKLMNVTITE